MTYEIHPTAQRPLAPLWGWMFLFLTEIFSGLSLFLASLWATLYLRALYTPLWIEPSQTTLYIFFEIYRCALRPKTFVPPTEQFVKYQGINKKMDPRL